MDLIRFAIAKPVTVSVGVILIVISGIILLGAVFLLYEVGLQCREWLSG